MGHALLVDHRVCRLIYDESQKGNFYSANGIEKNFGGIQGLLAIGKERLRTVLADLVTSKRLTKDKGKLVAKAYLPLAPATSSPTPPTP